MSKSPKQDDNKEAAPTQQAMAAPENDEAKVVEVNHDAAALGIKDTVVTRDGTKIETF